MSKTDPKRQPVRDVVVVLPGILGSVLKRGDDVIWSSTRTALFRNLLKGGRPIQTLELSPDCFDGGGVTADSLIPDTHMIPGLWSIDGYSKLAERIKGLPGIEKGRNYFEFPYDWRLDNRVAARELAERSVGWLAGCRSSDPDAKLILVAHSMGGLVSRYFLEVLGGWRETKALITIGTPYQGSAQALDFVSNGLRRGLGPVTLVDLTDVLRSLPSVYQLLPTYRCWSKGEGDFVELADAGAIPSVDASRVAKGRAFHDEIAQAARDNASIDEYATGRYATDPIAGVNQPTQQSATLEGGSVKVMKSYRELDRDGDGRVMREIATPDAAIRPWFVNQRHASLQNDDAVITQIEAILSEPRGALRDIHAAYSFGVDVDDLYPDGEPISVHVTLLEEVPPIAARLVDPTSGEMLGQQPLEPSEDGDLHTSLPGQPPGVYKLVVDGPGVAPVEDLVCVVSRA
jgi:pimeloyl-ACP methyl ester carboxylesterase